MKNIFIAAALLSAFNASAQRKELITDSSKTKPVIFSKTLVWIAKTWGDADKVIGTKDEATGTILGKGGLKAAPKTNGFAVKGLTLTELTFMVNNGGVKLDFEHTVFNWDAGTIWNFEDDNGGAQKAAWKADVLNEINGLIADYKKDF